MGFGFPRRHRLTRPAEFQAVLRGAAYSRRRGALRILANPNTMHGARLGLVVGKRAIRQAHARNTTRRVIREVFRHQQPTLPALDLVVQVRAPIARRELARLVERALTDVARQAREDMAQDEV